MLDLNVTFFFQFYQKSQVVYFSIVNQITNETIFYLDTKFVSAGFSKILGQHIQKLSSAIVKFRFTFGYCKIVVFFLICFKLSPPAYLNLTPRILLPQITPPPFPPVLSFYKQFI